MGDLLGEFVTETNESLDVVNVELVRFEQDPNNAKILDNIFRLVHTRGAARRGGHCRRREFFMTKPFNLTTLKDVAAHAAAAGLSRFRRFLSGH